MHDEYDLGIAALQAGDVAELENLTELVAAFPEGEDDFIGRRWITNAIDVGTVESVTWMLARGVDLTFRDREGYTPLHSALERPNDRYEVLEMLLVAGAPVNAKGVNDWTPAHVAAARDDVEALRILVRYGADLSIRTNIDDCATPLEEARNLGKTEAAHFLASIA